MSKLNTNSNTYIIIYSTILVVIVAFLLAFVSSSLKSKQEANVLLDTKKQVLNSLNMRGLDDQTAEKTYKETVKELTTSDGNAYYECTVKGDTKYVFPLKGMGLWGGISGFLALDDDMNTVFGAYFNHESETAGLGAEIKDSRAWQEKFIGKKVFGEDGNVALSVVKNIDKPEYQVDAVTGATLTSNGVTDMLHNSLSQYTDFIKEKQTWDIIAHDTDTPNADGEYNE